MALSMAFHAGSAARLAKRGHRCRRHVGRRFRCRIGTPHPIIGPILLNEAVERVAKHSDASFADLGSLQLPLLQPPINGPAADGEKVCGFSDTEQCLLHTDLHGIPSGMPAAASRSGSVQNKPSVTPP